MIDSQGVGDDVPALQQISWDHVVEALVQRHHPSRGLERCRTVWPGLVDLSKSRDTSVDHGRSPTAESPTLSLSDVLAICCGPAQSPEGRRREGTCWCGDLQGLGRGRRALGLRLLWHCL